MNDGRKITEKERREQRLQAALRENLKRRKAQARGRAESQEHAPEPVTAVQPAEPHDSAGIAPDKESG